MDRRNVLGILSAGAAAGCASLLPSGTAPLWAAAQPRPAIAARACRRSRSPTSRRSSPPPIGSGW